MTSISIGESVTSIGEYAFIDLANLSEVTCYTTNPPDCHENNWTRVDKATLYVPAESIDKYRYADCWWNFRKILPIGGTSLSTPKNDDNIYKKFFQNGQLYILRDGKTYTMQGTEIK